MVKIEYPSYQPQIKTRDGKEFIFDGIRKRWLVLTPEEWVRQNFIQYIVQVMKYPASLIAAEKEIKLGELTKRFDLLIYSKATQPFMIVECKEMGVGITEAVLNQALRYNITLGVPYIVITNGTSTFAFENNQGKMIELDQLPAYF